VKRDGATVNWLADAKSNDPHDQLTYTAILTDSRGEQQKREIVSPADENQSVSFSHLVPNMSYVCQIIVSDSDHSPNVVSTKVNFNTLSDNVSWPSSGSVRVDNIYANHASVSWSADAASTDPQDGVEYRIHIRNTISGHEITQTKKGVSGTVTVDVSGLTADQQYTATVSVSDVDDKLNSITSNSVGFSNRLVWSQRNSVQVGEITGTTALVSWQTGAVDSIPGAAVTYRAVIYNASGTILQQVESDTGEWNVNGLSPTTQYYVIVTALDDRGLSVKSNKLFFETSDNSIIWNDPGLQVSALGDMASVTWNKASPPSIHQGQATMQYAIKMTGVQSGTVYFSGSQLERSVSINGFSGHDTDIRVVITASDNLKDTPKTISESIPIGSFLRF